MTAAAFTPLDVVERDQELVFLCLSFLAFLFFISYVVLILFCPDLSCMELVLSCSFLVSSCPSRY
jgi:hypothetical protein